MYNIWVAFRYVFKRENKRKLFKKSCKSKMDNRRRNGTNKVGKSRSWQNKYWIKDGEYMGNEKKEGEDDKDENVIIPYALFEKMLKNQEEMCERFCRLILIILIILILPILAWAIGYFILL